MPALAWASSPRLMNLVGIAAAVVIVISLNTLASRFFQRWDLTSDGLYTLSPVTVETLEGLSDEVEIVVFLSRADPLYASAGYLLDAYRTHSSELAVRFVDPDRNPAEFIALQREYGIFEGRTEHGRLATEASIVVARGERRWYVTTDDVIVFDDEDGSARPRLEAALTEAIVNVLERDAVEICFTLGHQELALQSAGPQGLAEFRSQLERNNYRVRQVDFAVGDPAQALKRCDAVVVAGPLTPFSRGAALALRQHIEAGFGLLLAVGPLVDERGQISDPGLGPLLDELGVRFGRDLVMDRDPALSMPVGFGGEVFLASPEPHAITQGLRVGEAVRQRVLVQLTQAVERAETSDAVPLLRSSPRAIRIGSFSSLQAGEFLDLPQQAEQSALLGVALELPAYRRDGAANPARLVVLGSPSTLWSSSWLEPSLIGTRRFVENATSWVAQQPALVSVPEKQRQPAGLFLTEASLGEVQRYVLLYVPSAVLLLGGFVVFVRRREPKIGPEPSRSRGDA